LISANPVSTAFEAEPPGEYRLFPNPAQGEFLVERAEGISENAQIRVFSAGGRLVFQQLMSSDKMQINTADWPAGVYFVQMLNSKKSVVELLVVKKP
jgi:hypothetical protein